MLVTVVWERNLLKTASRLPECAGAVTGVWATSSPSSLSVVDFCLEALAAIPHPAGIFQ